MISQLTILERGGTVIWSSTDLEAASPSPPNNSNPYESSINKLIQSVLLSDHTASKEMIDDKMTLKWVFANKLNLVFVAVYFSFQKLLWIDEFLNSIKDEFLTICDDLFANVGIHEIVNKIHDGIFRQRFDKKYRQIIHYYATSFKTKGGASKMALRGYRSKSDRKSMNGYGNSEGVNKKGTTQGEGPDDGEGKEGASQFDGEGTRPTPAQHNPFLRSKTLMSPRSFESTKRGKKKFRKQQSSRKSKKGKKNKKNGGKKGKGDRQWGVWSKKKGVSEAQMKEFSMCDDSPSEGEGEGRESSGETTSQKGTAYEIDKVTGQANLDDSGSEFETDDDFDEDGGEEDDLTGWVPQSMKESGKKTVQSGTSLWSRFTGLIGSGTPLTESDLSGISEDLEKLLTSKNVTNTVARTLCDSVCKQLVGKQIGTFTSIKSLVRTSMRDALERILTPRYPINILNGIAKARNEGRPYVIVFIGVNGVGKSTSLSKVIFYLKSRNLQVSAAACDTFRSGAVEQLQTHCRALKVRLFDRGYARDSASVAVAAVKEAKLQGDDVVCIDTAGRMQNNAPLMRALASLIHRNNPDLILFVGEALVGNDGVDQLMEFDGALRRFGVNRAQPRLIDGIFLTKFDTVDDQVGASISMVYESGKPIVFVGDGQTYGDLKRMHVKSLVNKLLR